MRGSSTFDSPLNVSASLLVVLKLWFQSQLLFTVLGPVEIHTKNSALQLENKSF